MKSERERFEAKVDRNGPIPAHRPELGACHTWQACRDPSGYGRVRFHGKSHLAHRASFHLAHGRWPDPCALHRCDNPSCVNPEHLFEGTNADNAADKVSKGRQATGLGVGARGERHGCAKLNERSVRDIMANHLLCRVTQGELAERFGTDQTNVSLIVRRKHWAHLWP